MSEPVTSRPMPRPRRAITNDTVNQLAALGAQGADDIADLITAKAIADLDALDALAWHAGALGLDHRLTAHAVQAALDARYIWNEIHVATGESGGGEAATRRWYTRLKNHGLRD